MENIFDIIMYQNAERLKEFLDKHPNQINERQYGESALESAVFSNNVAKVAVLLDKGADVNENRSFAINSTVLHKAAGEGSPELVEFLLSRGANTETTDSAGRTPIFNAVAESSGVNENRIKITQLLIENGAKTNIISRDGESLMHTAAAVIHHGTGVGMKYSPLSELIDLLVKNGVDPKYKNKYNQTALHIAVEKSVPQRHFTKEKLEAIQKLINYDVNVNAISSNQKTALHIIAENFSEFNHKHSKFSEAIEILIENGADLNLRDENGKTPMDYPEMKEVIGPILEQIELKTGENLEKVINDKKIPQNENKKLKALVTVSNHYYKSKRKKKPKENNQSKRKGKTI